MCTNNFEPPFSPQTFMISSTTAAPPDEELPSFQAINIVAVVSVEDSKIIHVSMYTGRAEVTRLFKIKVATGQNQLNVIGLPSSMYQDSPRVEGRGSATIHDVTISTLTPPPNQTTSPALESLLVREKKSEKDLARAHKSLASLETYISSVQVANLDVSKLRDVIQHYDSAAEEVDSKVTDLEAELKEIKEEISGERKRLAGPTGDEKLNLNASIGIFADLEGEIEIILIYAVDNATWMRDTTYA